jgi:hypothetical protein
MCLYSAASKSSRKVFAESQYLLNSSLDKPINVLLSVRKLALQVQHYDLKTILINLGSQGETYCQRLTSSYNPAKFMLFLQIATRPLELQTELLKM